MKPPWLDNRVPQGWVARLLLVGIALQCLNLFSIATTQGTLQLIALSGNRFTSFAAHAVVLWLLLVAHEVHRARAAKRRVTSLQVANLVVLAICLAGAFVYFQYGARLSADGPHYFVQARSVLFDGDLDFRNEYQHVPAAGSIAERYPVGMGLFSLPFLLLAHLLLLASKALGAAVETNGFGYPYETAFGISGYLFGVLGLLAVLKVSARFVSVGIATLSLLTLWGSSFLAWYMVMEPSMPHAMSFAWTSFFLCFWLQKRPVTRDRDWIWLGCLAGAAALVRWQNGVLLLLPLLDSFWESPRASTRALLAPLAAAIVFLPQFLFWQATGGSLLALPLAEHDVQWTQISAMEVLFSTNRGLFPWNPAFYLGAIGLVLWLRSSFRLGALFLLGFLLQILINSNVGIWWAGWSFGGRRFDSCVLFFVVGMAVFLQLLRRRPLLPVVGLCGALCLWSVGVMVQSHRGEIPPDRLVSFRSVSVSNVREYYDRFGFPFASPINWIFARRYDVSPEKFDRLFGHEGYGNFRISFAEESEPFVGRGWGPPERDPAGEWFRWSIGDRSSVLVPLRQSRDYQLTVLVRPYEAALPNRVGLRVNGEAQLPRPVVGKEELRWTLGSALWRRGINELQLEFARTARPSQATVSSDSRELAVAVYRLELIAIPDGG